MQSLRLLLYCSLTLVFGFTCAFGQSPQPRKAENANESRKTSEQPAEASETGSTRTSEETSSVTIYLIPGGPMLVDEVIEMSDGFWYKRGNVTTFLDRARVERIERHTDANLPAPLVPIAGSGRWRISDAARIEDFFAATFKRPLPLSAVGQTELHNRWGLDHRNGMDVGLHPDSDEGRALITFLRSEAIPFLAFRSAIPGVATGPHIHIGNPSPRFSPR